MHFRWISDANSEVNEQSDSVGQIDCGDEPLLNVSLPGKINFVTGKTWKQASKGVLEQWKIAGHLARKVLQVLCTC